MEMIRRKVGPVASVISKVPAVGAVTSCKSDWHIRAWRCHAQ